MNFKKALGAGLLAVFAIWVLVLVSLVINRLDVLRVAWDLPEFTHEMGEIEELMLPMRDGVKLRTLQQLPKGEAASPTILIRNPYDTAGTDLFNVLCELFVAYGYSCIYQETRGQLKSEGEWEPLVNEPADTSDTLHWIAAQQWNDGNIGMWGVSYLALTQWAGILDYPPELKTFVPTSMGTDFHKILYEKGNLRLFVSLWVLLMPDRGVNVPGVLNFWKAAKHFPHQEIDEKFAGKKLDWYREWIRDPGLDDPTWNRADAIAIREAPKALDIPVLIYEGWYDPFFSAELQDYRNLKQREQSRMVIGPWSHIQRVASSLDLNVGHAMDLSTAATLEWFDYHLKGKQNADASGYVEVFDIGANAWRKYESWPAAEPELLRLEFSRFASANSCAGGLLTHANGNAEIEREQISYTYNPKNPVMSRGGASFLGPLNLSVAPGALTQKGKCERDDVLTFISEKFEENRTISGTMLVNLLVSSDAEDTAFTAKIIDVAPDGTAVNIRDTISTLSFRNHARSALLYEPNSLVEVVLDMWAIEWTIKAGHRLRVDVSSSNFPAYNIHGNRAGAWAEVSEPKIAQQTVYSGSYVEVPVL